MGAAARAAKRAGKTCCDGCGKPFTDVAKGTYGVQLACFGGKPDEPPRALCIWCDFDELIQRRPPHLWKYDQ
jgi:hypothetical protein